MESKNSGEGKAICVTGASGFIASWLVKLLLHRGYIVNATVCNLRKSKEELVDPAVKGTLNVLRSCTKSPSVRRVVITSSTASVICNKNMSTPGVVADETWYSDPEFCEQRKDWYRLSKTLAEQAAWKFAKENGIDLVTLHPGLVIGPLPQPTLNFSCEAIVNIIKEGKEASSGGGIYRLVDVRDVANAHILAFEVPSANGRYCLVGANGYSSLVLKIVQPLFCV